MIENINILEKNERINKNTYAMKISNYAFEAICKKKDVNESIDELLCQAGNSLVFDSIHVYEFIHDNQKLVNTFSWSRKEMFTAAESNFDYTVVKSFLEMHKEEDLISLLEIESPTHLERAFLHGYGAVDKEQILVAAIIEDGQNKGFVSFERYHFRALSYLEKRNLITTVNVLGAYLIKLRVFEKIRQKLDFMKNFDMLTKLPTLHKFKKDVKAILEKNKEGLYAIVYIDFKNFKYINESIGEEAADQILVDFGKSLKEQYATLNCIGRVESDRFIALLPFTKENELKRQVQQNNDYFRKEMKKKSVVNNVTLCAGICPIRFGDDINVAIDNANLARKSIGDGQQTNCKLFDQEIKNKIHKEIEIEDCMESALENGEFVVYLQPKINLATEEISGAEALVRWQKSEEQVMAPNEFIPIFERNGFIVQLDYFIYEEVCKLLYRWKMEGRRIIPISVNVSRIHLNDDQFIMKLKQLVEAYEIPASWLELELTESIFLDDKEAALSTMNTLREYGFYVSIDDFGAGYSSLNLLKDMNTDVLKLDKEFFRTGAMNREDKIIVSSIVSMAKQLNMKVLSEGIETKSQSEFLRSINCDMAQGYLFSKPVPVPKFERLLEA